MSSRPVVAIVGCGYVGLTTAAIFANAGIETKAVEINPSRLKMMRSGESFFYEEGIEPLLKYAIDSGKLTFTDSVSDAIPGSTMVFSCVGTPDNDDGSSNLSYVFDVAQEVEPLLEKNAVFVQKSTVPVGTGAKLETILGKTRPVRYVSNPEFLREGTALLDSLWPDRIVAGSTDNSAVEELFAIYKTVEKNKFGIAKKAGLTKKNSGRECRYISLRRNSAELAKVTANAFLALKISFANSIAKLADQTDADIVEIMDAVGSDDRIGRAFLNAGRGYGGGCFPKDVSGLIRSSEDHGVAMEIMEAAREVNESMPHYIVNKLEKAKTLNGTKIAVLGLSFKPGTSDTRRSPAIAIANTLANKGALVQAYDPQAFEEAKSFLNKRVELANTLAGALEKASVVIIATDWPEFTDEAFLKSIKDSGVKIVVDCMNVIESKELFNGSVEIISVGRN